MLRYLAYFIAIFCGLLTLILLFGPREPVEGPITFASAAVSDDPNVYLAEQEARFDDITPGVEKRVVWAGEPGARTARSIVYIHGFSATSEEIRPVTDLVADALDANIFYTRLEGHGRGSAAMEDGTVPGWINDYAEAMEIGQRIGDEVIVIATSTGGTVAVLGLFDDRIDVKPVGLAMLSPNFRVNNPAAGLLTLPLARYWVPTVAGAERSFEPSNEAHGTYWTTSYATVSLLPMAASTVAASSLPVEQATTPALFIFSREDQVVDPEATQRIVDAWGGPVDVVNPVMGPQDDPLSHVISGDIMSPGQTALTAEILIEWAESL
ncbi:alpha/beta hydrolase [Pontivivens insulae]|uniref:AB hydrolase-1 domain-containing protein n=1 Tax=Pontivivens insulae TaxID=1639689 RepID=A0A2R8ACP9_9RHOB|nr:alpha/beta fold hydrolase [Pontivivens insulae]RED13930.1 esterase/lipase [Pontivivens insulae]SPF30004.1 hypothetical protein POI8812_02332 [Pontivivens insulae]